MSERIRIAKEYAVATGWEDSVLPDDIVAHCIASADAWYPLSEADELWFEGYTGAIIAALEAGEPAGIPIQCDNWIDQLALELEEARAHGN